MKFFNYLFLSVQEAILTEPSLIFRDKAMYNLSLIKCQGKNLYNDEQRKKEQRRRKIQGLIFAAIF